MSCLFKNDSYEVVASEHSNKNYEVRNLSSQKAEYSTDVLPDAVAMAIGFEFTLNKLLSGDVIIGDDQAEQVMREVLNQPDKPN